MSNGKAAGDASATGQAFDASVSFTGALSMRVGTSLGPRLLVVATEAAHRSIAARDSGHPDRRNEELEQCLVAILCAQAAVEAQMNQVADAIDADRWERHRWNSFPTKWAVLAEMRQREPEATESVRELNDARNLVAHSAACPRLMDRSRRSVRQSTSEEAACPE